MKRYCSLTCQYAARAEEYRAREDIGGQRLSDDERTARAVAAFLATPSRIDIARYRKALRDDPCVYCGETPSAGIDHIVPTGSTGDRTDWQNMTGCCKRCNETKNTLPLLLALPWIPLCREYHDNRRLLFAPRPTAA